MESDRHFQNNLIEMRTLNGFAGTKVRIGLEKGFWDYVDALHADGWDIENFLRGVINTRPFPLGKYGLEDSGQIKAALWHLDYEIKSGQWPDGNMCQGLLRRTNEKNVTNSEAATAQWEACDKSPKLLPRHRTRLKNKLKLPIGKLWVASDTSN